MRAKAMTMRTSATPRMTRRSLLGYSAIAMGSSFLGGGSADAAREVLDIGLVAPGSGPDPRTLERVRRAIQLDSPEDPVFPEFKGKDVKVYSGDSEHKPDRAVSQIDRLHAQDKVQWLVSGDVSESVTKATELKAKQLKLDCILAASRMNLQKSNPHPYVFQIVPTPEKFAEGTLENISRKGFKKGTWWIVSPPGGQHSAALVTAAQKQMKAVHVRIDWTEQDPSAVISAIQTNEGGSGRPDGIVVVDPRQFVRAALANFYRTIDIPVVVDSYLVDPADLASQNWPAQTYFSTLFSRAAKQQNNAVAKWMAKHQQKFEGTVSPVTAYGAAAFQVIGRAAASADKNPGKVRIEASESLCGFGIAFDDQGANIAAGRPKLLRLRDRSVVDETP